MSMILWFVATVASTVAVPSLSCIFDGFNEVIDVDLRGLTLLSLNISSSNACKAYCQTYNSCKAYTFHKQACYLNNQNFDEIVPERLQGAVSGYTCQNSSPIIRRLAQTSSDCIFMGQHVLLTDADFWGNDLKTYRDKSLHFCVKECNLNSNCRSFTFYKRTCYLKHKNYGQSNRSYLSGSISGYKCTSSFCKFSDGLVVLSKYNFWGNDLTQKVTPGISGCYAYCQGNDKCNHFTYNGGWWGICYLKQANYYSINPGWNTALSSGYTCTENPESECNVLNGFVILRNTGFVGKNILLFPHDNVYHCTILCDKYDTCKSFTYTDGICYLHYGQYHQTNSFYREGTISGYSCTSPSCEYSNGFVTLKNTDIYGYDVKQFSSPSFESCRSSCEEDEECSLITFNSHASVCLLKHAEYFFIDLSVYSGATSAYSCTAPIKPPTSECSILNGLVILKDTYFPKFGNFIRYIGFSPNLEHCTSECKKESRCNSFVYISDENKCELKNQEYSEYDAEYRSGALSGYRCTSPSCEYSNGYVMLKNIDFYGYDVKQFSSPSFESCRSSCEEDEECSLITFNSHVSVCLLKHAEHYYIGTSVYSGAYSGYPCTALTIAYFWE